MQRRIKQIVYGGGYLVFWLFVIFFVYALVHDPVSTCFDGKLNQNEVEVDCGGVCASCALKDVRPIQLLAPESVVVPSISGGASGVTLVIVELRNPNDNFAADPFEYQLGIFDENGALLRTVSARTVLHPSEVRTEVLTELPVGADVAFTIAATSTQTQWQETSERPRTQIRELRQEFDAERGVVIVQGVFTNSNPYAVRQVTLHGVARDTTGQLAGGGRTLIRDLRAEEERAFQIVMPIARSVVPEELQAPRVFPAVER